jgi:eukaryotic-like serine/threonine-protein kinase
VEPPKKDDEDEGFDVTGPALDPSGTLEGRGRLTPVAPAPPRAPRPRAEALELEERPPRAQTDYVPPPPPPKARPPAGGQGGAGRLFLALLVLAGLGAGGWYFFLREKPAPARAPIAVVVLISSEPSGAAVSVEGTPVGVTPWAADNTWAPGPVNVTITHPGYRPWSGSFRGGRPARLEARLQRR